MKSTLSATDTKRRLLTCEIACAVAYLSMHVLEAAAPDPVCGTPASSSISCSRKGPRFVASVGHSPIVQSFTMILDSCLV
jgi:hypothetical protein